jgi:hypothetical protein
VRRLLPLALAWLAVTGGTARGEIAVLENGHTLKLDGHRADGDEVVLTLRGGGEMSVPAWTVRGFVPDEVMDEIVAPPGADVRALAEAAARRHGLPPELVLAVVGVESAFRPAAVSHKGAQGLMQLMPATAEELGVTDPFDPAQNLDGGVRHLGALLTTYDGDLTRALAAYNAGQTAVARYRGVPPYRETRAYVKKVLARFQPAPSPKKRSAKSVAPSRRGKGGGAKKPAASGQARRPEGADTAAATSAPGQR